MKRKKNLLSILISITIFGIFLASPLNRLPNSTSKKLSESEIENLRAEYPIFSSSPDFLDVKPMSLDEVISLADTFVYGEVIGNSSEYEKEIDIQFPAIKEKHEKLGIDNKVIFYEVPIKIIYDSEGIMNEGKKITIVQNIIFKKHSPNLQKGMKFVIPLSPEIKAEGVPKRFDYTRDGMFYVTESGYTLSVFDETSNQFKNRNNLTTSGIKVEDLMELLKKDK